MRRAGSILGGVILSLVGALLLWSTVTYVWYLQEAGSRSDWRPDENSTPRRPDPPRIWEQSYTVDDAVLDDAVLDDVGTIQGVVRYARKPPELPLVETAKDNPTCGTSGHSRSERRLFDPATLTAKNAVVYLEAIDRGMAFSASTGDTDEFIVRIQGCRYEPHVAVVTPGTSIEFQNLDRIAHSPHWVPGSQQWGSSLYIGRSGQYSLYCDVHPWMNAVIHCIPHPYWAITDMDGRYELPAVPAGRYRLICWKEGARETPSFAAGAISGYSYGPDHFTVVEVTVGGGETIQHDFELPVER